MARLRFDADAHRRITEAIRRAETQTSGEIYAVFARESDSYRGTGIAVALAASLAAGALAALLSSLAGQPIGVAPLIALQLLFAALGTGLVLFVPAVRMALVPARIQSAHARRMALTQFMAHNLHRTTARTGVLLFVSEAEHHAEILADAGIDAEVAPGEWEAIAAILTEAARRDRLAEGYVAAIEKAGALLSSHFPSDGRDANEIPDRLAEI